MSSEGERKNAKVVWDEQGLPLSLEFDDIYFSKQDGIAESRYVFLHGNDLLNKWRDAFSIPEKKSTRFFTIAETGFGTGLNFLLTWQLWEKFLQEWDSQPREDTGKSKPALHYISVEKYPLTLDALKKSLNLWPELAQYTQKLLEIYPPQPATGFHKRIFPNENLQLTLIFEDAAEGFSQLLPVARTGPQLSAFDHALGEQKPSIDAWYLDGFAPAKNPDMWSESLFAAMAKLSKENTSLATFTAASFVRKSLIEHAFKCEKIKGFGRKREMLVGSFQPFSEIKEKADSGGIHENSGTKLPIEKPQAENSEKYIPQHFREYKNHVVNADEAWQAQEVRSATPVQHCIVIGGGMGGCHTAFALANKGIRVTLLEKNKSLAMEASGNRQGVVYGKMSLHPSPINTFNLKALLFANDFYHRHRLYEQCGDACGVIQFSENASQEDQYKQFANLYQAEPSFVRYLDSLECSNIAGLKSKKPGLFFQNTGWLDPRLLCQRLIDHPNISYIENYAVDSLVRDQGSWLISSKSSDQIFTSETVVIASAYDAVNFSLISQLPLKRIRGQVSHIKANQYSETLRCVLCGDGYISPAVDGTHAIGASFNLGEYHETLSDNDHQENLNKLEALSPELHSEQFELDTPSGKVGFRCTAPDYFPLIGPVPDFDSLQRDFAFLRKKANAVIDAAGASQHGLYLNTAHGSRGLCYTPLSAEIIASLITGDFLPIETELYRYLHPARFLIRDLKRNKV